MSIGDIWNVGFNRGFYFFPFSRLPYHTAWLIAQAGTELITRKPTDTHTHTPTRTRTGPLYTWMQTVWGVMAMLGKGDGRVFRCAYEGKRSCIPSQASQSMLRATSVTKGKPGQALKVSAAPLPPFIFFLPATNPWHLNTSPPANLQVLRDASYLSPSEGRFFK